MQQLGHRTVRYDGVHCHLGMEQFPTGVVVIRISGSDVGEFGEKPMSALSEWLAKSEPVDLFIDARDVRGASVQVSADWAQWLSRHKSKLRAITMLTGSRYIEVTAQFVRRFAALDDIMHICGDPEIFDRALSEAMRAR